MDDQPAIIDLSQPESDAAANIRNVEERVRESDITPDDHCEFVEVEGGGPAFAVFEEQLPRLAIPRA
jgi:hypothetical protein